MKKKRLILAAVLAAIVGFAAWDHFAPVITPPGQPPLAELQLANLREQFNAASGCVRLVVLLSPT